MTASLKLSFLLLRDLEDALVHLLIIPYHISSLFDLVTQLIFPIFLFVLISSHISQCFLHLPVLIHQPLHLLLLVLQLGLQLLIQLILLKIKLFLRLHMFALLWFLLHQFIDLLIDDLQLLS